MKNKKTKGKTEFFFSQFKVMKLCYKPIPAAGSLDTDGEFQWPFHARLDPGSPDQAGTDRNSRRVSGWQNRGLFKNQI